MACQCGTQEEIEKLYKLYGVKLGEKRTSEKLWDNITYYFYAFLYVLGFVITLPIIFIVVLLILFWREDGKVNIKYFNLLRLLKIKTTY